MLVGHNWTDRSSSELHSIKDKGILEGVQQRTTRMDMRRHAKRGERSGTIWPEKEAQERT